MTTLTSRLLDLNDITAATNVISQSFQNDPLISFMLPLKFTRVATLKKFFTPLTEISIKNKRVYGVGEPLQGVAYWKSPEEASLSVSIKSLAKFLSLLFTMYPIGYFRGKPILDQIDAFHAKYANEPHYYLDNLGVLPTAQGKGFSSPLIRPILDLADSKKVDVYTDTVTESNVSFYEHFGFQCVDRKMVSNTGITVYAMKRAKK